jgi:D-alanyl-D-alanine carboxypeptidase (penicillin-binding protein 5/6)
MPSVRQLFPALCLIALTFGHAGFALAFETKAKQAILVEADSGMVLFAKDVDQPFPPAALAKLMTMETLFDLVATGKVAADAAYPVSENAWRTGGAPSGGSTMFAALKSTIPLPDLIRGAIVQSANDGCIIIAEGVAGSEEKFVELMNQRATALGLAQSTFKNTTGLPADGQQTTVKDLVQLAQHIWKTYPSYYAVYSEPAFTWNKITQRNRNPLLAMNIGADGMGTGYTEESGYSIVGAIQKDGARYFLAMSGLATDKERGEEARKLLEWALIGFNHNQLFGEGETVGTARVYGGVLPRVPLRANGPVSILVHKESASKATARIEYVGPLLAPIKQGDQAGALVVRMADAPDQKIPLFAAQDVDVGPLHRRAYDAALELLLGWTR